MKHSFPERTFRFRADLGVGDLSIPNHPEEHPVDLIIELFHSHLHLIVLGPRFPLLHFPQPREEVLHILLLPVFAQPIAKLALLFLLHLLVMQLKRIKFFELMLGLHVAGLLKLFAFLVEVIRG